MRIGDINDHSNSEQLFAKSHILSLLYSSRKTYFKKKTYKI